MKVCPELGKKLFQFNFNDVLGVNVYVLFVSDMSHHISSYPLLYLVTFSKFLSFKTITDSLFICSSLIEKAFSVAGFKGLSISPLTKDIRYEINKIVVVSISLVARAYYFCLHLQIISKEHL